MNIGRRVRLARLALGVSQRRLAEIAGLSPAHVGLIESHQRVHVRWETLHALADALAVDASWLMDGEGRGPRVRRAS